MTILGEIYDNSRDVYVFFRNSNIVIAKQNKLFDTKLPYWLSSSAI